MSERERRLDPMGGGLSTRRAIAAAPFAATRTTRATPARAGVAAPPATGVDADPTDDDGSGWDAPGGDFVQSRARGLAAIRAFDAAHPAQTLSDVARRAGLSRATARRVLHTLVGLGYADSDGRLFRLRPKVLELGFAYLHGTGLWGAAQPPMVELVERIHESCSAAVLDGDEIVYVARVPTRTRIMSITLGLGSRLPAHLTSMGRVLLAALPPADADALRRAIAKVRAQGFAILDQELEPGLRSVAVPVHGPGGAVVAALNVGTHASRVTLEDLKARILPALRETAESVSRAMGAVPG
ncbi:MAG TPA: IclR family transcriptional regulator C-terminal domain-containing protein [Burkholderiaceae bacterium]|nr:IclR family transcriptional regulator C-terminal domain-containing protein [Burkholderiaceae bacterium]